MALGFALPEVKFLSITLDGGTDLLKRVDDPHTEQSGDSAYAGLISNASDDLNQAPEPMKVDVVLSIKVGFDITSNNLYSSFFKNDFAKYLKLRVVQSTNPSSTSQIFSDVREYLRPGGLLSFDAINNPGLDYKDLEIENFEGSSPELSPDLASSIEIKYDSNGKKTYMFPYTMGFTVTEDQGGLKADHLTYFAYAYIDIDSVVTDEGLFGDIEIPEAIVEQLSIGQVNTQTVIQNGTTNNFSQVFYETPTDSNNNPVGFDDLTDENDNIIGKDYSRAKVWTGQFHYHGVSNPGPNGYIGYMAGEAGADMGPFLTPVTIGNNVIQDFREIKELEKISFDYSYFSNSWFNQVTTEKLQNNLKGLKQLASQDNPYLKDTDDIETAIIKSMTNSSNESVFGNMYVATDGSGNKRFMFSFDIKEAVKQNTVFPGLVNYLLEEVTGWSAMQNAQELLDQKLIKELKIYRHRVYDENIADPTVDIYEIIPNLDAKLVVETLEGNDGQLITKQQSAPNATNTIGTIRQVNIDTPLNDNDSAYSYTKRFYTGTDLQGTGAGSNRFVGDYIYSIEVTMTDPIIKWMEERIKDLEGALYGGRGNTGFKDYVNLAKSNPDYYNRYTNRFTQAFINEVGDGSDELSKINAFLTTFYSFSSFDISRLITLFRAVSSPLYGSPSGAETALRVMETMYKNILNVFASASKYKKPIDSQHVESQYAAGSNPRREFTLNHKFNTEIQGGISHLTGYDYLSLQNTKQEDSSLINGLKSMSFGEYDSRVLQETNKLFPISPNSELYGFKGSMTIYKEPLADHDLAVANIGETQGEEANVLNQGEALNPSDSPLFTKYAYLSPSIVNFEETDSQNLLNGGSMVTDIQALNNTLLNIIKYNTKSGQEFDFPNTPVATGVGLGQDKIIPEGLDSELKYDLLNLMSLRQATVLSTEDEANPSKNSTLAGGTIGGSTTAHLELTKDSVDDLNILYETPDDEKKYDTVDIFSSTKDPVDILLAATEQKRFNILGRGSWNWEYYVENFEKTFHKEYETWKLFSDSGLFNLLDLDPYVVEYSPLKRAPNHVKALMLHLDWTKDIIANPAFESLKLRLIRKKPHAYNYDLSGQVYGVDGSNFFGVSSKAYEINGLTSYNQIYPKNKVIYQTPEFLSFFLLNYKNIVKIECLAGYENDNINNPVWQELTLDMIELFKGRGGNVLCRMMPYEKKLYGVERHEFANLPIYNDHFIIDFRQQRAEVETTGRGVETTGRGVETRVEIVVGGKRRRLTSGGQGDSRRTTGTRDSRDARDARDSRDARGIAIAEERERGLAQVPAEDLNQTLASTTPQGSAFMTPQPSAGDRNLDSAQSSNTGVGNVTGGSGFGGGSGGGYGGGGY